MIKNYQAPIFKQQYEYKYYKYQTKNKLDSIDQELSSSNFETTIWIQILQKQYQEQNGSSTIDMDQRMPKNVKTIPSINITFVYL